MNGHSFTLCGARLRALASGGLHWPEAGLLVVSDLHLGKAERIARRGGTLLPPYETRDTLERLQAAIEATAPTHVICLGDSFDDDAAATALPEPDRLWLARLMAGRDWTWVEGNHDPNPVGLGGSRRGALQIGPLWFRHIAQPAVTGEVSGHYHPKVRLALRGQRLARPAFLIDAARVILPAFGTFTGGLWSDAPALAGLMQPGAQAVLTGRQALAVPMPGAAADGD